MNPDSLSAFLRSAGLEQLDTALTASQMDLLCMCTLLDTGRPALFAALRRVGIGPEAMRQRLANSLARARRAGLIEEAPTAMAPQAVPQRQCRCVDVSKVHDDSPLDEPAISATLECLSAQLAAHIPRNQRRAFAILNRPRDSASKYSTVELPPLRLPPPPLSLRAMLPCDPTTTTAATVPLVSVISPTTSDRHWAHEQLYRCFSWQTWPNKELLVIDDGPIPSPFFQQLVGDARVTYTHRPANRPPVAAAPSETSGRERLGEKRNRLCAAARGALIAHFDDDDLYLPGELKGVDVPVFLPASPMLGLVYT